MLDRTFDAPSANRKWVADFTYIWTVEGWLYVAAVLDLFSRGVVGWGLVMAIWRRGKPDALLHHSDRGSQYTSEQFQRLMADHGVTCSMCRSGNRSKRSTNQKDFEKQNRPTKPQNLRPKLCFPQ